MKGMNDMSIMYDANGNAIDSNNPLPIKIVASDAIVPTDKQSGAQTTVQVFNAVSVATGTFASMAAGAWIDTDGFQEIGIMAISSLGGITVNVSWSPDQTNSGRQNSVASTGTDTDCSGNTNTRGRYLRLAVQNTNASTATMSVWVYLKA